MEISNRPTRLYRVIYENLKTLEQFNVTIESTSSYEAGESVLKSVGEDIHDLIIAQLVKPNELN